MQALFTEECSLVDAFVFFAYTTSPVFMLSLLQWCGMDVKQRAGKTQASIKRKRVKKVHPWPKSYEVMYFPTQGILTGHTAGTSKQPVLWSLRISDYAVSTGPHALHRHSSCAFLL